DVVNEVAQWRGGSALGLGTKAAIQSSVALVAITVPRADPTWYVRGGAALERFWLTTEMHGLAVQPVSPVFLYATDEDDLATLGGERYLDEMYALSAQFRDFWEMNAGEAFVMVLRVFYADAPSVHSIRYRLREVLSRSDDVTPIRDMAVGL
ncbi:MAG: Rv1355c family protein, partial [Acidimicrobiales bacterium]